MRCKVLWALGLSLLVSVVAWAEPAKQSFDVERDIHYVPDGDASQTLDVYLPKEIATSRCPW